MGKVQSIQAQMTMPHDPSRNTLGAWDSPTKKQQIKQKEL